MLSTELLNFQSNLNKLLNESSYKAAKKAFIKSLEVTKTSDIEKDENGNLNIKPQDITDRTAEEFGKIFGKTFSEEVSNDLAKLIMNYIKSAEITITCQPTALATVASPVGPCTGSLLINKSTANIQIL